MYDGYYIYTPFTNKLGKEDEGTDYYDGQELYGLKPYVHYSCRYVTSNVDVVITYTLDNCITVEGTIDGKGVYKTGYLLDDVSASGDSYRGVQIQHEGVLRENLKAYMEIERDDRKWWKTYNYRGNRWQLYLSKSKWS